MFRRRPLLLLLTSIRFANLPSVVSNVWLGVALGVWGGGSGSPHLWLSAGLLTLAGLALYISGNFLNDWYDRDWDARNRPERALPQGIFPRWWYLALALGFMAAGVGLAGLTNPASGMVAGLILVCILGYTRWHKVARWPMVLMGICRGLLPVLGVVALMGPLRWPLDPLSFWLYGLLFLRVAGPQPLALVFYVVALSQIARHESLERETTGSTSALVLAALAGLVMAAAPSWRDVPHAWCSVLPFALWLVLCFTGLSQPPGRQVSALLAGLPLLDWVALLPLGLWLMASQSPHPIVPAVALVSLLLPPLAFIAARLLQRLTPAT